MDSHKIKELLFKPHRAALALHERPDGDSIGSNLALAKVLTQLGSTVQVYSVDTPDPKFSFLTGFDKIIIVPDGKIPWTEFDIFWALDMSSNNRMGEGIIAPQALQTVVIDHHKTNTLWGNHNLVEINASTTLVLYKLLKQFDLILDNNIASALLTGLSTDTSFFTNDNVTSEVFEVASKLMSLGADFQVISFNINRQLDLREIAFFSYALGQIKIDSERKLAYIAVPNTDWQKHSQSPELYDFMKEYLRSIKGTDLGIMFTEERPGYVRLGLRSRNPDYDVSALAQKFGGGGHKAASGASISGLSLEEVVKKVLEVI